MAETKAYHYLKLEGTREALIVSFIRPEIMAADEIIGVGRELLAATDMAERIAMPLVISFQGVETISSALVGKLVLMNRKARSHQVKLQIRNMSPAIEEILRRTTRGLEG